MEQLTQWLLGQSPAMVIMGLVIFGMYKTLVAKDEEIARLNSETKEYAKYYRESAKEFAEIMGMIKEKLK